MTNFQLLSDLHMEFHSDKGKRLLESLDPEGVDCLLLAGDICTYRYMADTIQALCEKYPRVLLVCGNHEYYGSSPTEVHGLLWDLQVELGNFIWLHNELASVDGVKVAGTTLWFPRYLDDELYKHGLNDFKQIREFDPWVYEENEEAQVFLGWAAGEADIVMTHHLPHPECISPRYRTGPGAPFNRYFCCDMSKLIDSSGVPFWVCGHSHDRKDFKVNQTRILMNPKGYPHERDFPERGYFNPHLVFDVTSRASTVDKP